MRFLKVLLALVMVASTSFAFASIQAKAETQFDHVIKATIPKINNEKLGGDSSFVMYLSETDFMTANEWDNTNYKWYDAETHDDYASIDFTENNLCNFPLDKNLEEYNFEQKILIDGVTLAEYKVEHPYTLVGNKRTRVDTISIDFIEPVLSGVDTIEILEGCQFPTLLRGCLDNEELSCIEVVETVKYQNHGGVWTLYFEGYQENLEYDGDERMFSLSRETEYKGHTTAPLEEYSDTFIKYETLAGGVYKGLALASSGDTQKGYLTVLRFVHPIDAEEFGTIDLRVYTNHKRTIHSFNDSQITEESMGNAMESFTLDGAVHTRINLRSSLYADEDGKVRTIVFMFNEDGVPFEDENGTKLDGNGNLIRDQLFFVSFNLQKAVVSEFLTKDSFFVVENDGVYEITFRFNKACQDAGVSLDASKVVLNGESLKKILSECKDAFAKWSVVGDVFQINVTLPVTYVGSAQIKNVDNGFTGNSMGVLKGLVFPDGTVLDKSYTCHVYAAEKFIDSEIDFDYEKTKVVDVSYEFVKGSDNLHFKIHFDRKVTTASYYHACEIERWRETELYKSNPLYYDSGMAKIFVKNGFKSSLLDCIVINGKTIGDWHAVDSRALTNIQTHYGQSGFEYVDVHFESLSKGTYNQIVDFAKDGNGITIEIKEGLKFMTNCSVQETQTFVLKDGQFVEQQAMGSIHVYYDGGEVVDGANITVQTAVDTASLVVVGVRDYEVSHETKGNVTVFTVSYDDKALTFTVTTNAVQTESQPGNESQAGETESSGGGCKSLVEIPTIFIVLAMMAIAITLKERRKYE